MTVKMYTPVMGFMPLKYREMKKYDYHLFSIDSPYLIGYDEKMDIYKNIMQSLTEAVEYQQGKNSARKTRLSIKPAITFKNDDIRQIRQRTGLSQVMFAGSLGISPKTVEAWENGRNKPEGASRRLLEIVCDEPDFLKRFHVEAYVSNGKGIKS